MRPYFAFAAYWYTTSLTALIIKLIRVIPTWYSSYVSQMVRNSCMTWKGRVLYMWIMTIFAHLIPAIPTIKLNIKVFAKFALYHILGITLWSLGSCHRELIKTLLKFRQNFGIIFNPVCMTSNKCKTRNARSLKREFNEYNYINQYSIQTERNDFIYMYVPTVSL